MSEYKTLFQEEADKGAKVAWYFRWVIIGVISLLTFVLLLNPETLTEAIGNIIAVGIYTIYNLIILYFLRKKLYNKGKFFFITFDILYISIHIFRIASNYSPFAVSTTATIFIYFIFIFLSVLSFDKRLVIYSTLFTVLCFNLNYYFFYNSFDQEIIPLVISSNPTGHIFKSIYIIMFGIIVTYVPKTINRLLQKQSIIIKKGISAEKKLEINKIQEAHLNEKLVLVKETNSLLQSKNSELRQQKEEIETIAGNLQEANEEVNTQKNIIEKILAKTTDSINYASRIQQAVLPSNDILNNYFAEHFVFYRPKEVVSGDFYLVKKIKKYIIITVADCTGHGVPGAFVSMLGISYLNEIIRRPEVVKANMVLEELRKQVKESLNQSSEIGASKDGMDMAFCLINTETNILQYAGAYNSLYIFRDDKISNDQLAELEKNKKIKIQKESNKQNQISDNYLIEIKADRQPVAVYSKEHPFENHEIQLQKGDSLYLFSDGYVDQFHHKTRETFKTKHFKELFFAMQDKNMQEQLQTLENTFENWKGDSNQIDDVVVLGVKV